MTNREAARILDRIADMLLLKNENPFRIAAYRKAADSIYHLDEDLRDLHRRDAIGEIEGVGSAVKGKIEEMLQTGKCTYYETLKQEVPQGLLAMLALPGIGPKTIRRIYEELHIDNLDDLAHAACSNIIRKLPGMGARTESNILKGIDLFKKSKEKSILGLAVPLAEELCGYINKVEGVMMVSPTGSVRRGKSLVGDIDILVAAQDFSRVFEQVKSYRNIKEISDFEPDVIRGYLDYDIKFEVIMVKPEDYYHSLVWTTGSKEHREVIFAGIKRDELKNLKSEEEVYTHLGIQYIPPEMRENRGEIEKAKKYELPQLVKYSDIKGDLHVHTDWSDGAHSLEDMAKTAKNMGYSYLAITDHSKSLHISGGLSEERLIQQARAIDELNAWMEDFTILKGSEVDILKDGTMDFDDDTLKGLDVVIASIHSYFNLDRDTQTRRILKAIENEHVDIIGHLTGRLLNRRSPYELDIDKILTAAARNGTILEINSHPDRLDINEDIARKAADMGIKIAINSDAHDKKDLYLLKYGILCARRAWLTRDDIVNVSEGRFS